MIDWKFLNIILLLSAFALSLVVVDMVMNWSLALWYLPYNLFLAWIPLIASLMVIRRKTQPWLRGLFGLVWLTFLPNSYYTVTDIIHTSDAANVSYIYDTVAFFMIAASGLLAGAYSLLLIDKKYLMKLKTTKRVILLSVVATLVSVGLYLGRILRWNSWDLITNPFGILSSFATTLSHPWLLIQFLTTFATFVLLVAFSHILMLQLSFPRRYN